MDSIQLYQAARKVQPSAGHDMLALAQELGIHVEFVNIGGGIGILGVCFKR